jgi:hypothetical protein
MRDYSGSIPNYNIKNMDISIQKDLEQKKYDEELLEKERKKVLFSLEHLCCTTLLARIRSIESLKTPQKILEKLKEFIKTLRMLEHTDLSEDWRYCEKLSNLWMDLKQSTSNVTIVKKGLDELFAYFESYPEMTDHSLGYYLANHTGEEWIPFPFMDILKKLHTTKDDLHDLLVRCEQALRSLQ